MKLSKKRRMTINYAFRTAVYRCALLDRQIKSNGSEVIQNSNFILTRVAHLLVFIGKNRPKSRIAVPQWRFVRDVNVLHTAIDVRDMIRPYETSMGWHDAMVKYEFRPPPLKRKTLYERRTTSVLAIFDVFKGWFVELTLMDDAKFNLASKVYV